MRGEGEVLMYLISRDRSHSLVVGGVKPRDSKLVMVEYNNIGDVSLYTFCALSILGCALSIAFLVFSCKYKHLM